MNTKADPAQAEQLQALLKTGFAELSRGNLEAAGQCCQQALEIRQDVAPAHFLVGLVAQESKDRRTAFSAFQSVVKLDPDHGAAWAHLAKLYMSEGQVNMADEALRETLRIKGTASITRDPALLQRLAVGGKPALLCTRIAIEECFFHCGKAMIRSGVWKPETWGDSKESLLVRQIVTNMEADEATAELIESELEKNYRETLY